MRVLIADDDRVTTALLAAALVRRKWQVMIAQDGMQAVMQAMRVPSPDVIVLDLNMPGGTGFTVLERLRASTRTQQIPVVILTGSLDASAAERAEALGAARFLKKPIEPDALAEILSRFALAPA
jgi:CheY-like chemotaxis protein